MVFSSMIFLWCFLPVCLAGYYLLRRPYRNIFLLLFSLFFYAWGEANALWVLLLAIVLNYGFGLLVERGVHTRLFVALAVIVNLGILGYFKYYNFFAENARLLGLPVSAHSVIMPIGISFFTFQSLSYVIDVYRAAQRGERAAQPNVLDLGLYVSFFPQLIAGPIVRYHDIAQQLRSRQETLPMCVTGIKRFICGLGKKVLIANVMGQLADAIFALAPTSLGTLTAWCGALAYTLQIYYDFAGYSDMAIGLGRMFGFTFLENFDYPYLSKSVREFWRRWHISLSSWFREYLYIPLGGNRKGSARTYFNLLLVFLATGLWHGANWTFVLWGLYHGAFLIAERFLAKRAQAKPAGALRGALGHAYTMLVVVLGWVLFRCETLTGAAQYFTALFTFRSAAPMESVAFLADGSVLFTMAVAILLAGPIQLLLRGKIKQMCDSARATLPQGVLFAAIFMLSAAALAAGQYNPFIYFRF
ncbi:MAG: MBOAT family protein [Ruthenibacterium sp.]